MNCEQFLNEIFELKDDQAHILLWELENKKSSWFKNVRKAADYAKGKKNIYVGVGLSNKNRGKHKRYEISQVDGVPGFAVDIDVQHDKAHRKKNLPKTIDEARSLIEGFGFDPTLIIHSGHGIQAWWLFKEPEMFDDNGGREATQNLSRRLHNTIKERAIAKKLTIDNVSDISRILRPVGTINHKKDCKAVEVTALRSDGPRYNSDDFDEMLIDYEPVAPEFDKKEPVDPKVKSKKKVKQKVVSITKEIKEKAKTLNLDANAEPPQEEFGELVNVFAPVFWDTWTYNRSEDFESASEYDFSLAVFAAKANWNDQQIMDLLVSFRQKNKLKLHLNNKQKYIRTIVNARRKVQDKLDVEAIDEATTFAGTVYQVKEKVVEGIRAILGVKILKITKYIGDEYEYEVEVETEEGGKKNVRSVHMTSTTLLKFHLFEPRMYDVATAVIKPCDKKDWYKVKLLFKQITEERKISKYDGFNGEVFQWLGEYLDGAPVRDADGVADNKKPFFSHVENKWFIDLNKFIEWAKDHKRFKKPKKEMLKAFRALDLEAKKFTVNKASGIRSSMKPWGISNEIASPPDESDDGISGKVIKL